MPVDVRGKTFYREADFKGIRELRDEKIPGLYCPDCHAEAFKTDETGVAVCGSCPGWYFLYQQEVENKELKYKVEIVNGDYQTVPVYKTKTIKKHP